MHVLMAAPSSTQLVLFGGKLQDKVQGNGVLIDITTMEAKKIKTRSGFYTEINQYGRDCDGQIFGLVYDNNGTHNLAIYDTEDSQLKLLKAEKPIP